MKILVVLDNGGIGGAEKLMLNLTEKTIEQGHEAAILILEKNKAITTFSDKKVTFLFATRRFKLDIPRLLSKISTAIIAYGPQIIIANGLFSYFFIAVALKINKIKLPQLLIFHTVSTFSFRDRLFDFFYILVLHIFKSRWVVLYPEQVNNISRRFFLKKEDIKLMRAGVDIYFYIKKPQVLAQGNDHKEKDFTIVHISSLKFVKNQNTLFKGLKVFDTYTNAKWQLLIVGCGEAKIEAQYKRTLKKLGIYEKVKFLGLLRDVREVLKISDIFVLTSFTEAIPLSALEALSMGIPCILPRVGGCSSIIEEGVNGYLIEPKDHLRLAKLLAEVYANEKHANNLKENSRRTVIEKFNLENTVKDFIDLCNQGEIT